MNRTSSPLKTWPVSSTGQLTISMPIVTHVEEGSPIHSMLTSYIDQSSVIVGTYTSVNIQRCF